MKVLLIQPPIQDFYQTEARLQPIGLCYLKAAIRKHLPEVEVKIRDYHHGWTRRTIPIPSELSYLKSYYPYHDSGPFSSFHRIWSGLDHITTQNHRRILLSPCPISLSPVTMPRSEVA